MRVEPPTTRDLTSDMAQPNYYTSLPHYLPSAPLTGLSPSHPSLVTDPKSESMVSKAEEGGLAESSMESSHARRMESMHIACKGLLILVKLLGGEHIKVLAMTSDLPCTQLTFS